MAHANAAMWVTILANNGAGPVARNPTAGQTRNYDDRKKFTYALASKILTSNKNVFEGKDIREIISLSMKYFENGEKVDKMVMATSFTIFLDRILKPLLHDCSIAGIIGDLANAVFAIPVAPVAIPQGWCICFTQAQIDDTSYELFLALQMFTRDEANTIVMSCQHGNGFQALFLLQKHMYTKGQADMNELLKTLSNVKLPASSHPGNTLRFIHACITLYNGYYEADMSENRTKEIYKNSFISVSTYNSLSMWVTMNSDQYEACTSHLFKAKIVQTFQQKSEENKNGKHQNDEPKAKRVKFEERDDDEPGSISLNNAIKLDTNGKIDSRKTSLSQVNSVEQLSRKDKARLAAMFASGSGGNGKGGNKWNNNNKWEDNKCPICKKHGHSAENCWFKNGSGNNSKGGQQ